jgi:ABC-type taurine transport system ATPase subunit
MRVNNIFHVGVNVGLRETLERMILYLARQSHVGVLLIKHMDSKITICMEHGVK